MSEKLAEVYEKYDMEIMNTRKGRGAIILTTTDGLRILEPFRGSIVRLEQEYVLKRLFAQEGYSSMDMLIPNKEGELFTCDRYRQPFVLKKHFDGVECDMHNPVEIIRAVEALARLHTYGKRVAERFQEEWEESQREKERKRMDEIQRAIADGEELERIAHVYEISQVVLEEALKEQLSKVENKEVENDNKTLYNKSQMTKQEEAKEFVNDNDRMTSNAEKTIAQTVNRHNAELKKIRKFIGRVKRKNKFEDLFLHVFSDFYRQGIECAEMLEGVLKTEEGERVLDVFRNHYGICHGNYNHHNVILGDNSVAIVHFERFSKGNQLGDLYQFARKAMEKNHFDYELLEMILDTYAKQIQLSKQDYRYIYVLFAYPEKFWKIANNYYNTNKAFLSPKYLEKLKTVIQQEKEKNEMLSQFFSFHLQ